MGAPGLNHEEKLKLGTKWKSEFLKRGQECLLVMEHPSCRDAGVFGDTMLWRYHGMTAEDNGSHSGPRRKSMEAVKDRVGKVT